MSLMEVAASYQETPDYLAVKVHGPWTEQSARQIIDDLRREADSRGYERILVDLKEWSSPKSEMTRFASGAYLAEVLPAPFKIAAFARPEVINRFGETVAVNRYATFSIFEDEDSAVRWLTGR